MTHEQALQEWCDLYIADNREHPGLFKPKFATMTDAELRTEAARLVDGLSTSELRQFTREEREDIKRCERLKEKANR